MPLVNWEPFVDPPSVLRRLLLVLGDACFDLVCRPINLGSVELLSDLRELDQGPLDCSLFRGLFPLLVRLEFEFDLDVLLPLFWLRSLSCIIDLSFLEFG